jgi:hypothetical protein
MASGLPVGAQLCAHDVPKPQTDKVTIQSFPFRDSSLVCGAVLKQYLPTVAAADESGYRLLLTILNIVHQQWRVLIRLLHLSVKNIIA